MTSLASGDGGTGQGRSRQIWGQALPQHFLIQVVVKPDDHFFTDDQGRCPQVAGWPNDQLVDFGGRGLVLFQVEMRHALSLGRVDLVHLLDQCQRITFLERCFLGIDFFDNRDVGLRKKLLRLPTRLSATPMV